MNGCSCPAAALVLPMPLSQEEEQEAGVGETRARVLTRFEKEMPVGGHGRRAWIGARAATATKQREKVIRDGEQ